MIKSEMSMIVRRPIDEVFEYVSDLTHSAEWQSGLLEVQRTTAGSLGIGTKYTLVRQFMGRRMEASNEFIEFVPNSKVAFKTTSGPIPLEASYLFESTSEGTRLTSIVEMQAEGFVKLAEPIIAAGLKREMEAAFAKLKDLLERQVTAIAS